MSSPVVILVLLLLLGPLSEAREILVGGRANSWKIPESADETLNHWAQRTRFKVGDSLLWRYDAKSDSVMQVTEEDYKRCERSKPIKGYKDGKTLIELDRSGPFLFISGEEGRCHQGEKLIVVVLSPNHCSPATNGIAPAANEGSRLIRTGALAAVAGMLLVFGLA